MDQWIRIAARGVAVIVLPERASVRTLLHTIAAIGATFVAVRTAAGQPWWIVAFATLAAFAGCIVAMVPFGAAWCAASDAFSRHVRAVVEEELMRFDLQSYDRQLARIMPEHRRPPEQSHRPGGG